MHINKLRLKVGKAPFNTPAPTFLGQANFARAVASLSKAQAKKVARFLPNPERHWGPKLRAGRQITSKHISLLGEEAVNGCLNHQESEHEAKRQKTEKTEDANASES